MPSLDFSPAVQHWVNVTLIWVGFGALAGLTARTILPLRRPTGPAGTLVLGILGSVAGLLALSALIDAEQRNPIGPLGFVAATAGTLLLLLLYQPLGAWRERRKQPVVATPKVESQLPTEAPGNP